MPNSLFKIYKHSLEIHKPGTKLYGCVSFLQCLRITADYGDSTCIVYLLDGTEIKKCPFFPPWGDLMAKEGCVEVGVEGGNSGVMEMRGEKG